MVFALVKKVQAEVCDRFRIPDTKGIYDLIVVSYDRHIIRHCQYRLIALLYETGSSCGMVILYVYITAEFYFFCIFRTTQFKGIAVFQPVIGNLYLVAVSDLLFEQTIVITDTAAVKPENPGNRQPDVPVRRFQEPDPVPGLL